MGLDAVEIVLRVEETFDIAIDDLEAEACVTPRHVIDLVMRKVGRSDQAVCLTQKAFHRLRASLMRQLHVSRTQIKPDSPLNELLPRPRRRQELRQILSNLAIAKDSGFVRPAWLSWSIFAATVGAWAAVAGFVNRLPPTASFAFNVLASAPNLAGLIFAALTAWISIRLSARARYAFKPPVHTVGGLSRWVVAHAPNLVQAPPGPWSRAQVAEKIREIVIKQLGSEKYYREDAHFYKDLGLG